MPRFTPGIFLVGFFFPHRLAVNGKTFNYFYYCLFKMIIMTCLHSNILTQWDQLPEPAALTLHELDVLKAPLRTGATKMQRPARFTRVYPARPNVFVLDTKPLCPLVKNKV